MNPTSWSRRDLLLGLGAASLAGCRWPFVYDDRALMTALNAPEALTALLAEHARRYPVLEPADAYKLLHQRHMGPGHLVSAGDALAWLEREAAGLEPLPAGAPEVEIEALHPGQGLARVHLRPWLARGATLEALATAFSETAARWQATPERLAIELDAVGPLLDQGSLPLAFDRAAWEVFTAPLVAQGLPAVHHSEAFRAAYGPAYRVVRVGLLEKR